jgi:WXXGXW repeat (2 copies)
MTKPVIPFLFIVAILLTVTLTCSAQHYVLVQPAAPSMGVRPASPKAGYIWVGEEWKWLNGHYVWVGAHWVPPPYSGAVWVPGHWRKTASGWYWIAGHWVKRY